jgi:hypothetical protein
MSKNDRYCMIIKSSCQKWFIDMEQQLQDLKIIDDNKNIDLLIDGLLQLRHQLWIKGEINSPKDEATFKKIAEGVSNAK